MFDRPSVHTNLSIYLRRHIGKWSHICIRQPNLPGISLKLIDEFRLKSASQLNIHQKSCLQKLMKGLCYIKHWIGSGIDFDIANKQQGSQLRSETLLQRFLILKSAQWLCSMAYKPYIDSANPNPVKKTSNKPINYIFMAKTSN